jgi:hypothetical protein
MTKYRVYALIHGHILPEGPIFDCEIKKMPFAEQEARGLAPIQAKFYDGSLTDYHTTYVTRLAFVDPIRIKSEYVVVCEIDEHDIGGALGEAIRRTDKLCRLLSLTRLEDGQERYKRERLPFEPYIYQINKVYRIDENGSEIEPDSVFDHGGMYLPDRPEANEWMDSHSKQLLEDLYATHDDDLERALKYLYRSSIGHFVLDSPEKIALDHAKAIEIILGAVSSKDSFEQKLQETKQKLDLTDEEIKSLKELWQVRSEYGDIAHPSRFDQAERYPNQFPLPSNSATHPMPSLSIAANVCLKYFRYRRRLFYVDIEEPHTYTSASGERKSSEGRFAAVNSHIETNHLAFYTKCDKQQLIPKLKAAFAAYQGIDKSDVESFTLASGCKRAAILIKQTVNA